MIKKAKVLWAETGHKRYGEKAHHFSYNLVYTLVDIDTISSVAKRCRLFSYNAWNLFSLHDKDFLKDSPQTIAEKLRAIREEHGLPKPHQTWLLTFPRFFYRGFNPVSFYFELNRDGSVCATWAEVTNTYGERHLYHIEDNGEGRYLRSQQDKVFHVSPFLAEKGQYHFTLSRNLDRIEIYIRYIENSKTKFYAHLIQKEAFPMTDSRLLALALRYPAGILGAMPRILKHAAILHFVKKIPAAHKPIPRHANTLRKLPPSRIESILMTLVFKALSRFELGTLVVTLPDGTQRLFGKGGDRTAHIQVQDYRFFKALALHGEIGFGESFVNEYWDSPNLGDVLHVFLRNKALLKEKTTGSRFHKWRHRIGHALRSNSIRNARQNIGEHYDLSNKMYALFLDKHMNYSSGVFASPTDTLEDAQTHKLERLIAMLRLRPEHHVLEIGSGWGAAAIKMAKEYGCNVTTLTLSEEQFAHVNGVIREQGLQDKVTVLLQDYRYHSGSYDRILSIEMIEAVGHRYLSTYFETLDRLLKRNGLVALQAITIPDQRYENYKNRQDWIQKYIFPGGHLPSLSIIQDALRTRTHLLIEQLDNIGPHYAKTLLEWRRRFLSHETSVRALGFDTPFIRKWVYYLTYCEVGFANRYINTVQLLLSRPINEDLIQEDLK